MKTGNLHPELGRLSHLEGIRAHKSNGMSKGDTKVFTTKAELISLRSEK